MVRGVFSFPRKVGAAERRPWMAVNRSYADLLTEWEALVPAGGGGARLAAWPRHADLVLPRDGARALMAEKNRLEADRRVAVSALQEVFVQGLEVARDFRAELRGHFGVRSERLVQYDMKP